MKAILILNKMPERCGDCQLLQQMYDDEHEKWFDMCFWRQCEIKETEGKLNDCPLKPVSEKDVFAVIVNNEVVFIEPHEC